MDKTSVKIEKYNNITRRKKHQIYILLICILISFIVNLFFGSSGISFGETIDGILLRSDDVIKTIVWSIRMPSAISAIVVGIGLGMAGCEMQTILNNPMASPYTLGISSAASLGAALGIVLDFNILPFLNNLIVGANAFVFTLITSFIIFYFAKKYNWGRSSLLLFGIALSYMLGAFTTLLQYFADENSLQALTFWRMGDLNRIGWSELGIIVVAIVLVFMKFSKYTWKLTAMTLGDEYALSIGVDVYKLRRSSMIYISFVTAVIVAFSGTIGFVGIVAPHISRIIVGEEQRYFLITSCLVGSLILSVASILSKVIIKGMLLPIGLVTSVIGSPVFIYLILKEKEVI